MSDEQQLETIVASFRDTNRRLTELAEASERLIEAGSAFDVAKDHAGELIRTSVVANKEQLAEVIASSQANIESSQRALRDTTSGLITLIDQVRDVSREIGDITDAFRKTKPERVLAEMLRNRIEIRIAIGTSAIAVILSAIALVG